MHVRASCYFRSGNVDLVTVPIGIGNGGAKDDAIEPGPESIGHAHGARLTGGIHGVAGEARGLKLLAGEANGTEFGMGRRVVVAHDSVGGAEETLARSRVNDEGAKGSGMRAGHCEGGKLVDFAHSSLVEQGLVRMGGGRTYSPKTPHGAI